MRKYNSLLTWPQINVRGPANAAVIGDAVPFAVTIGSERTLFQATMALR